MGSVVLTVIGDDRAGLVHALSEVVTANGGNWQGSRLVRLGGKFAGVVEVTASDPDALIEALRSLEGVLDVTAHAANPSSAPVEPAELSEPFRLTLVGADHPGIVAEVTAVLTRLRINILALDTWSTDAPMEGRIFQATAQLQAPPGVDARDVATALEAVAHDLMVDITVSDD